MKINLVLPEQLGPEPNGSSAKDKDQSGEEFAVTLFKMIDGMQKVDQLTNTGDEALHAEDLSDQEGGNKNAATVALVDAEIKGAGKLTLTGDEKLLADELLKDLTADVEKAEKNAASEKITADSTRDLKLTPHGKESQLKSDGSAELLKKTATGTGTEPEEFQTKKPLEDNNLKAKMEALTGSREAVSVETDKNKNAAIKESITTNSKQVSVKIPDGSAVKGNINNANDADISMFKVNLAESTQKESLNSTRPDNRTISQGLEAEGNSIFQKSSISGEETVRPSAASQGNETQLRSSVLKQVEGKLMYLRETAGTPAEMRVTLHPPELGEVTIRVFSRQGKLSASIVAESNLVKEILESSIGELKQRINFVNIQFEQLDVSTNSSDTGSFDMFNSQEDKKVLFSENIKTVESDVNEKGTSGTSELPDQNRSAIDFWA